MVGPHSPGGARRLSGGVEGSTIPTQCTGNRFEEAIFLTRGQITPSGQRSASIQSIAACSSR